MKRAALYIARELLEWALALGILALLWIGLILAWAIVGDSPS